MYIPEDDFEIPDVPPSSDPIPRKMIDKATDLAERLRRVSAETATEAVDEGTHAYVRPRLPPASLTRYERRIRDWVGIFGQTGGKAAHRVHWLLHNNVVHPLIGVATLVDAAINRTNVALQIPSLSAYAEDLHHLSSHWLNQPEQLPVKRRPDLPPIPDEKLVDWVMHNLILHPLIGLCPCHATFQMHDDSARDIGVKGRV